ncbi:MAG: DUF952 domain-containing protein [Acidobacteriota bacterium]|nr:DUF952 domain-containing protein [Acidobacteriota bacterium]
MATIFHIAERQAWNQSKTKRSYRPEMFSVEGFIHCSTAAQVLQVANTRFRGRLDLLLLALDTDRVDAEIRYENLEGGEQLFPHIYGELDHEAVIRVAEFKPGADGSFAIADWRLPIAD